ncbi:hypothetical protein M5D96_005191 [Drosophila gunungcola]|uniref:Uncharacterized protein n=1 Tax=Drosophila gunungcola TaxID=103775 RepID=A0A9P9YW38_9MUSC|nr:hypothetical protein M5D96_005191 [Drosophila gunungcola]
MIRQWSECPIPVRQPTDVSSDRLPTGIESSITYFRSGSVSIQSAVCSARVRVPTRSSDLPITPQSHPSGPLEDRFSRSTDRGDSIAPYSSYSTALTLSTYLSSQLVWVVNITQKRC